MIRTSTVRSPGSGSVSVDARSRSSCTWLTSVLLDRRPRLDVSWTHPTTAPGTSVEAELVALGVLHDDEARVHRPRRPLPQDPGSDRDELLRLGLQRRGPVGTGESWRGTHVEVQPVLSLLALRDLLEEQ